MSRDALLASTRLALHALAEQVISPLRVQATGHEIALQVRPDGFGTPGLPDGGWVGVAGTDVVVMATDGACTRRAPVRSLRGAAELVGLAGAEALPDAPLEIHAGAATVLAAALALGDEALGVLAAGAQPADDVSPVRLWPEHFDIAIELGPPATRATYGVSPGDAGHDEPYAYVAPWTAPPAAPFWNARGFTGAERTVNDLDEVVAFWRDARARLAGERSP